MATSISEGVALVKNPSVVQLNTQTFSGKPFMISPSTARTKEVMNEAKKGFVILLGGEV